MKRLQTAYASDGHAGVIGAPRGTHRCQSYRDEQAILRTRLRDLAAAQVRYGYRRLYVLLQREG